MINRKSRHRDAVECKSSSQIRPDLPCVLFAEPHIIEQSGRLAQLEERSVYTCASRPFHLYSLLLKNAY